MTITTTSSNPTERSTLTDAAQALPKYDLYGMVHKGLRGELCALLARMAAHSPAARNDLQMILDDLEGVLYICVNHGSHEDRHYHPALEARRAGSSEFLNDTHALLEADVAALHELSAQLSAATDGGEFGLFRALYLRYSAFVGRNLLHMAEEETRAQALFEQLYEPEELPIIHMNLLRAIGPEDKLASLRAMLHAVNAQERMQLLELAHAQLPREIWCDLLANLRARLPATELRAIAQRYPDMQA
jgi:hypothetical protein